MIGAPVFAVRAPPRPFIRGISALGATVGEPEGKLDIHSLFKFQDSPFILLLPYVEVAEDLVQFGIDKASGVYARKDFKGVVDHLQPVKKLPEEKLGHRIGRPFRYAVLIDTDQS